MHSPNTPHSVLGVLPRMQQSSRRPASLSSESQGESWTQAARPRRPSPLLRRKSRRASPKRPARHRSP
eukprot:2971811-Prymnesium_polylepis.2